MRNCARPSHPPLEGSSCLSLVNKSLIKVVYNTDPDFYPDLFSLLRLNYCAVTASRTL